MPNNAKTAPTGGLDAANFDNSQINSTIDFTKYTSPEPLSKRYWIKDGKVHKEAVAQMSKGTAERLTMTFLEFEQALGKADSNTAFGYGLHSLNLPDRVKIVCKGKEQPDKNIISRSQDYFKYSDSAGVLMLDHDPSEYGQTFTPDDFLLALCDIHPEMVRAARIVRGSVSAGVHLSGEPPQAGKGFHIYVPVANASDISRYGKVLFDRLWLAGRGFIALSSNGAMLLRNAIDATVFSPERLDFVGLPLIAGGGLEFTPPQVAYTDGGYLDTLTLPDLTPEESANVAKLQDKAKEAIKPRSAKKQAGWAKNRIADMVGKGVEQKAAVESVNKTIASFSNKAGTDLFGDFILEFLDKKVSVAEVVANPRLYDRKALADPIEGSAYGTTTAKFYWNNGKPVINSLAHGMDTVYFLHKDNATQSSESDEPRLLTDPKVSSSNNTDEHAESCTTRPEVNPVITALRGLNLYVKPLDGLKHEIVCPFGGDQNIRATYYEPTTKHPRGGYFCKCPQCHRKHSIGHLLNETGVTRAESLNRPVIKAMGGELANIVDFAEAELSKTLRFFQQGGMIVKLITDDRRFTKLAAMNKTALNLEFNRMFAFIRFDGRSKKWVSIDAPSQYSLTLFESMAYDHLPHIIAVAHQPFFRDNSTLCATSGYDPASKTFGIFEETGFKIPKNPTAEEFEQATAAILGLLTEFEFKADADNAAAVCAILTAVVRPALSTAPGFLATAHCPGSGKSYLLDIIAQFAASAPAAAASFLPDDDEMRKQLISALMESPAVLKFDEMKSDLLPIKTMLSCLSAEQIEGRILGSSKIVRPSTRTLMLFAGNNVQAVNDMCRRIVSIHLDVQSESPATRSFKSTPLEEVTARRTHYVSQALTVIVYALNQIIKLDKPLAGFSRWEQLCRRTVVAMGLGDPCANTFEQLDFDPDREQLGAVIRQLDRVFNKRSFKVREIADYATQDRNPDLWEAVLGVAHAKDGQTVDVIRLSRWVARNVGKYVDGMRIEEDTTIKLNTKIFRVCHFCPTGVNNPTEPTEPTEPTGAKNTQYSQSARSAQSGNSTPMPETVRGEKNIYEDTVVI